MVAAYYTQAGRGYQSHFGDCVIFLAMPKGSFNLRAWALVGAQQRLRELDEERVSIFAAFPQLRDGARGRGRPRKVRGAGAGDGVGIRKRKRRKMSAAARKKISDAQKARWAKQKKAEKTTR